MTTRRQMLGGLGAACALAATGAGLRAGDGGRLLTATDVHVKDYPTVLAVQWIGRELRRRCGSARRLRSCRAR